MAQSDLKRKARDWTDMLEQTGRTPWEVGVTSEVLKSESCPSCTPAELHVLTLTPFYPTENDDTNGCFVAEPLIYLARLGVKSDVLAVRPFYRGRVNANAASPPTEWVRYPALPGGWGLASAGVFLFARVVGWVRELHRF